MNKFAIMTPASHKEAAEALVNKKYSLPMLKGGGMDVVDHLKEGLYEPDSFVTPAALSKAIIGDLLRRRLRFGGVAITDDLASPSVTAFESIPDAAARP